MGVTETEPRLYVYPHALVAKELDAGTSMNHSAPVMPLNGLRTDGQWMQQHAHLARLLGSIVMPSALRT